MLRSTRRAVSLALTAVMLAAVVPITVSASTMPSAWATDAVATAKGLGLATADLTMDYQAGTTRLEFCRAAVNFLRQYGYDVNGVTPKLFADTIDRDIGIAAALGITSGTDAAKNLFSPNQTLTREQAATMLNNVLSVIGLRLNTALVAWADTSSISDYAKQAASDMYNHGVMSGTDTTKLTFSPKTPYTHEQSITTLLRLWNYLGGAARVGGELNYSTPVILTDGDYGSWVTGEPDDDMVSGGIQ